MSENQNQNNGQSQGFNTPGVRAVQINAARQMVELNTRGRLPNLKMANKNQLQQQQQQQAATQQTHTSMPKRTPLPSSISRKPHSPAPVTVQVPAPSHSKEGCSNPQCSHCGSVIIPAPKSSLPINDSPSICIDGWEIYTTRKPIFSAEELDVLEERYDIPLPEMVFGHNKVEIYNPKLNWGFGINTIGAMDRINTFVENPNDLIKVSYANEWHKARQNQQSNINNKDGEGNDKNIMEVYKPYDWTYSSDYKGDEFDSNTTNFIRDDTKTIPLDKLKQRVPILFFQEFVLYEDELGDNGISMLTVKIRCMSSCMLVLLRFFLRVDNVIFRIYDTRIYIDFEDKLVIREFKQQESKFDYVSAKINPAIGDPRSLMRDSNWCSTVLETINVERDYVYLS